MQTTPQLLTVRQVAGMLGYSITTVRRLIERGELDVVDFGTTGRSYRIDRAAVLAMVARRTRPRSA